MKNQVDKENYFIILYMDCDKANLIADESKMMITKGLLNIQK